MIVDIGQKIVIEQSMFTSDGTHLMFERQDSEPNCRDIQLEKLLSPTKQSRMASLLVPNLLFNKCLMVNSCRDDDVTIRLQFLSCSSSLEILLSIAAESL